MVFCLGCITPWTDPYTGSYGEMCHQAKKIRRQQGTEHYHVYRLGHCDGMDAYLHEDPIRTSAQDIADGKLKNTLLLLEADRLKLLNKELDNLSVDVTKRGKIEKEVGPYLILKFE